MFEARYSEYLSKFNTYAEKFLNGIQTKPPVLGESIKYSFLNGGKRIRPVLALATAEVLSLDEEKILPFALALEMIHTYSLIHDDLPAMDNDDFRRGQPSNHKAFGEGNAILAGDALLNTAYSICFTECGKGEEQICAANILCECAGINGMIAGQSADLAFEKQENLPTERDLFYVYERKTGKLLTSAVTMPSVLARNKYYFELEKFGLSLGMLFQITDDILDEVGEFEKLGKSIGKDKKENKLTSVKLYGIGGAKVHADMYAQDCYAILDALDGDTSFLRDLVSYVREREK